MGRTEEIDKIPLAFIVGMGRSGTTLLRSILDAHPHTRFSLESKLIIHLKKKYSRIERWTPRLIDDLVHDLYKDRLLAQFWEMDPAHVKAQLMSLLPGEPGFSTICKQIYLCSRELYEKEQITLIGDKNPVYSLFIPELREVFPDSKFIHIVRDPRAVIRSNMKLSQRKSVAVLAHVWKRYNSLIEKEKKDHPDLFYTLRYEDLVADPEHHIRMICSFLGIAFRQEMMQYHQEIRALQDESEGGLFSKVHPNLRKPVNTERVDAWKKELTEKELALADRITSGLAQRYHYEPVKEKQPSFYFRSLFGRTMVLADEIIIKGYYLMPFIIRDALRYMSLALFGLFRFTTVYNEQDFGFYRKKD